MFTIILKTLKKLEFFFIHSMRPLSIREPPSGRGVRGVLPPALYLCNLFSSVSTSSLSCPVIVSRATRTTMFNLVCISIYNWAT